MAFAVCVTLTVYPGQMPAFMELMRSNAEKALRDEPGCLRFDVAQDDARPDEVFLYELYKDAAAFQAHLATPHFLAFDAAAGPMIAQKDIRTYTKVIT